MVATLVFDSTKESRLESLCAREFTFLVDPKEVTIELFNLSFVTFLKYSSSFGLEPGHPPSIYEIPASSSFFVIFNLSSKEREMPSCCAPSLKVVS